MDRFLRVVAYACWMWLTACVQQARPDESTELPRAVSHDGRNMIVIEGRGAEPRRVRFKVIRDGRTLIGPSRVGPVLAAGGDLGAASRVAGFRRRRVEDEFPLAWGKTANVSTRYGGCTARLETPEGIQWEIDLRAYDDGVAFRYRVPEQEGLREVPIGEEITEFRVDGEPTALFSGYDNYTSPHEAAFQSKPIGEIPSGKLLEMPLLLTWPDGAAAAITEGRVRRFAGMYLQRPDDEPNTLRARLAPLPSRPHVCVTGKPPIESPWRVVLLGDSAGQLLESNLLLSLNDPPPEELGDFSWARPGKTSFPWWNGEFEDFHKEPNSGQEFERHKQYIDFCAKYGIAYHSVTGDGRPWYVQEKPGYAPPHADADVLTPRPELRLPELVEYARDRGVRIRLWVHWRSLKGDMLEKAFSRYEAWGIAGLMVDFLDRDDQEMIEWTDRMLESAARHKLHIQIHGSPKFSGEQRTFPHLFNREGVMNLEYLKWTDTVTPQHNVNVAYTRALAGPVDYHLGGFRSVSRADFKPQHVRPVVMGTRCHHLALYVVYENPMPMVADTPDAYEGQAGFDFLAGVPTTWDETRFVAGEPGEYVVLARRRGEAWYLGGVTNWTPREVSVPLGFLGDGEFAAKVYADGSMEEQRPNEVRAKEESVDARSTLSASLAPGGGFVAVVEPK